MDMFLLYLFTRIDTIHHLFVALAVYSIALVTILLIIGLSEGAFDLILKYYKKFLVLIICTTTLAILTPTQKDAIFIVVGTGILTAVKSESGQRISNKALQFIEDYIDSAVRKKGK